MTANESNTPWLFPTQQWGKHLTSGQLHARLRKIGLPSESGRCAALLDICTTMPAGMGAHAGDGLDGHCGRARRGTGRRRTPER